MRQFLLSGQLAMADLRAELVLAACTVLALAAVLAPLLILAGLRAGVVQGLREALLEDPRAREVTTAANRSFASSLLEGLAARPDVSFLAPRTRTLAASLLVEALDAPGGGVRVELIPTAPEDPLLGVVSQLGGVEGTDGVVLSAAAAARLRVGAGAALVGRLARVLEGRRESVALALTVRAVAPAAAFAREAAFVSLPLAVLVEDFQDGKVGAPGSIVGLPAVVRAEYAGFRLYARRLEDVPGLDAGLRGEGIEVVSRAGDVAGLLKVDRNLGLLFGLVAGMGGAGFLGSLGAGLWANVERKRVALAQLRFLGLRASALRAFPMAQAGVLGFAGVVVATGGAKGAAVVINRSFAGILALDRPLCLISLVLVGVAGVITVVGAVAVAAIAGTRAARVEPWEGMSGG